MTYQLARLNFYRHSTVWVPLFLIVSILVAVPWTPVGAVERKKKDAPRTTSPEKNNLPPSSASSRPKTSLNRATRFDTAQGFTRRPVQDSIPLVQAGLAKRDTTQKYVRFEDRDGNGVDDRREVSPSRLAPQSATSGLAPKKKPSQVADSVKTTKKSTRNRSPK